MNPRLLIHHLCRNLGDSRMQMEDFEGSLEWFDRLADVKEDAEVFYYRGVAYMALEKYEEAMNETAAEEE